MNVKTIVARLLSLKSTDLRQAGDALERLRVIRSYKAQSGKVDSKEFEAAARELLCAILGPDWDHATDATVRRIAAEDGYDTSVALVNMIEWDAPLHPSVADLDGLSDIAQEALANAL